MKDVTLCFYSVCQLSLNLFERKIFIGFQSYGSLSPDKFQKKKSDTFIRNLSVQNVFLNDGIILSIGMVHVHNESK